MEQNSLPGRATMKDVAEKAGVSTATVSRALASPDKVSAMARMKVMQAISELGYAPELLPRHQRKNDSQTLLILVPDICDPFFHEMIRGIEVTAAAEGYLVLIGDCAHQDMQEVGFLDRILTRQIDGLLLLGSQVPPLQELVHRDQLPPLVMANEFSADLEYPTVHIDNLTSAFNAVNYLLDTGLNRIACITGPDTISHCRYRRQGYIQALQRHNIEINPHYLERGDFSFDSGAEALTRLMKLSSPPEAVFCHNDRMALGVLHQAAKMGIRVPQQLSVIGFDDIDAAQYSHPPLTTISQPRFDIGREAATLLMEIIRGERINGGSRLLEARLQVRQSTLIPAK
ncbi:DNA-binding transcriptional regulator CytR [Tatumella citrea]